MSTRCEDTGLFVTECACKTHRPDLAAFQPVPEVWMRATGQQPIQPSKADVRAGNVHALFQVVGGRRGKPEVVDMVRELCEPAGHSERYSLTTDIVPDVPQQQLSKARSKKARKKGTRKAHQARHHRVAVPSLLAQLDASLTASSEGAGASRPAESRPTANLDAIDTAGLIEAEAGTWLRYLGAEDPLEVTARVRRLGSLIPGLERCHRRHPLREDGMVLCCRAHQIEVVIGQWWVQARVITGWDMPAFEPNNTCPLCGVRGRLRVRFLEQLAFCLNCRESWDDTTIGLLADHIRTENHEDEEAS